MDEATSRTRTSARRMATAKPATKTRGSSGGKGTKKGAEPEISPARWAGVALVITAIVAAIVLAVISPSGSEPSELAGLPPASASPGPAASPVDDRVPTERVAIVIPTSAITPELDIEVTVDVPEVELPRKDLAVVILRDGKPVAEQVKPKLGSKQIVGGVRLNEGVNELTAALRGPGGLGPLSEPVIMTVDRDAPKLTITSPKAKTKTFDDVIEVTGTSEPGAEVRIQNTTAAYDQPIVVGPNGTYEHLVPLKKGANKIIVTSTDGAGMVRRETTSVQRKDGKPVIEIDAPKTLKRGSLPREIKVSVHVTDSAGENMEGAMVSYNLGGPGRIAETFGAETNANGRSNWFVEVAAAGPGLDSVLLTVEVTSPYDLTRSARQEIPIS